MFRGKIVLGSSSPRRKTLVEGLGLPCEVRKKEVEEVYPDSTETHKVPEYLAKLKSEPLIDTLRDDEVLLTSDTVVIKDDKILHKPKDRKEAIEILKDLSGEMNEVVTGVCLRSQKTTKIFSAVTKVYFSELREEDIIYYVDEYKPFDKAGAYGIQEWIGQVGVERIDGCFYNVMGLPVHLVWEHLQDTDF